MPQATDPRQQRGLEIAALCRIDRKDGKWIVPSMSGGGKYTVTPDPENPTCTCPDFEIRGNKCKHIFAAERVAALVAAVPLAPVPTTATVIAPTMPTPRHADPIQPPKRPTYTQVWPAYNAAQVNEQDRFKVLLRDLCDPIPTAPRKRGRPRVPLADVLFAATYKVYSTFSGRRFMSDMRDAQAGGHVTRTTSYNSISRYLDDPALTPHLHALIVESSRPLAAVERDFAADSSGFSTCRFIRWFDQKYGAVRKDHDWVKAHIMCGVKTNVVTAVEIRERLAQDSPLLPDLLKTTEKNFTVSEVSADKGYSSINNVETVAAAGAVPFIAFKAGHTGKGGGEWARMFHYFNFRRDEFLAHYHKRSNAESTFSMVKAKFGDAVRSKSDVAMKNEVLCKFLAHNICCLIQAIYELDLAPVFWSDPTPRPGYAVVGLTQNPGSCPENPPN